MVMSASRDPVLALVTVTVYVAVLDAVPYVGVVPD
jgi:hypothetical protein